MQQYNEEALKQNAAINFNRPYQQCAISVMDTIADPHISFDEKGISNYYYDYQKIVEQELFSGKIGEDRLEQLLNTIKKDGKNKPYDCITGVSGGVDSSYLVWKAKEWGLRPLVVHFDNGWNSEIAVQNINKLIEKTGFDLYTIVVDWEEFRDLQLAYLKASVVDIEVPTDHAITGTLYKLAKKYNLRYILSGNNIVTEAILPASWCYSKNDYQNIININKQFGNKDFKTYPLYGFWPTYSTIYKNIVKTVKPLNFVDYNKEEAKSIIQKSFGWQDYGGKHYESVFTKFYQAYILPVKFGIDKRKAHLSSLIFSGQISKDLALEELTKPIYKTEEFERDLDYFLKKTQLSREQFEDIMKQQRIEHKSYGTIVPLTKKFPILKIFKIKI
jgi:N-acetyl sugar amidotransferase